MVYKFKLVRSNENGKETKKETHYGYVIAGDYGEATYKLEECYPTLDEVALSEIQDEYAAVDIIDLTKEFENDKLFTLTINDLK